MTGIAWCNSKSLRPFRAALQTARLLPLATAPILRAQSPHLLVSPDPISEVTMKLIYRYRNGAFVKELFRAARFEHAVKHVQYLRGLGVNSYTANILAAHKFGLD